MKYCFGVDIGGTTVKMGLFEETGAILDKWEIPTRTANGGEAILPDVAASLAEKRREFHLEADQMVGVGVGIPAPVDEEGLIKAAVNLGWGAKNVKEEVEALTGMKARIGNDANMAALGEMWKGAGNGQKNMVMVTLGTGVGGGIIVGGKVLTGVNGAGGEIGHICVNYEETASCGCGSHGCLEQYASATGIVRLAKMKLKKETRETVLFLEGLSAKMVFDAVKEGDTVACEIAEEFGTYLGHALANIAAVADPSVFVIGGGVSKAGDILLDYIRKPYLEKSFFAHKDAQFALATLGNDAGICGAAKLILG